MVLVTIQTVLGSGFLSLARGYNGLSLGGGYTKNLDKKIRPFAGLTLDYEFKGKPEAYIDGHKADTADLSGISGIAEIGVSCRQKNSSIDLALSGAMGKRQGYGITLNFRNRF